MTGVAGKLRCRVNLWKLMGRGEVSLVQTKKNPIPGFLIILPFKSEVKEVMAKFYYPILNPLVPKQYSWII
jgi:hypothetical protein